MTMKQQVPNCLFFEWDFKDATRRLTMNEVMHRCVYAEEIFILSLIH
jgi:hypothetical protein